jgi:hypothetical protein
VLDDMSAHKKQAGRIFCSRGNAAGFVKTTIGSLGISNQRSAKWS